MSNQPVLPGVIDLPNVFDLTDELFSANLPDESVTLDEYLGLILRDVQTDLKIECQKRARMPLDENSWEFVFVQNEECPDDEKLAEHLAIAQWAADLLNHGHSRLIENHALILSMITDKTARRLLDL